MMTDLFSALDCMQIGWMSTLLWLTPMVMASTFAISNSWGQSNTKIFLYLLSTNSETRQKALPSLQLFVFGLMGFILFMNLLGLVPFVYAATSSIWVAASLALVFWTLLILSGWVKFPIESAAHLAPSGAPAALMPLLILIETVSICIRPITLMVRLIANISAGHIIMGLIANAMAVAAMKVSIMTFPVHVGYSMFELFVCFIQAYVFSLLVKLYSEEHPAH
uniref:ATP synthase F0 subunit 6 n=1 Tax=Dermatobranchus otome TaxID=1504997 RepID=UPI001FF69EF4|nr:ATP synthase F0 subunit 6 [Dermatobranchus otome]UOD76589.1 ATP synthase F0 subunit 6 [Dermatobranchus otome]UOD76602.1 ATP synthase F0 subunit 6 [Dermatobranchus otome]